MPHQIIWSWYTGRWWVGCYIWYGEEGTGRGYSPPSPLLAVTDIAGHPSTASVPITVLLYNGPLLCGFNVPIKGLTHCWRCREACDFHSAKRLFWAIWSISLPRQSDSRPCIAFGRLCNFYVCSYIWLLPAWRLRAASVVKLSELMASGSGIMRFCTGTGHFQAAFEDSSVWTIIRLTTDLVTCPWSFAYGRINTVVNNNNNNNNIKCARWQHPASLVLCSITTSISHPTCPVTRKMTKRFFAFNCRLLVHCSADAHLQNDWRCAWFLFLPRTVARERHSTVYSGEIFRCIS